MTDHGNVPSSPNKRSAQRDNTYPMHRKTMQIDSGSAPARDGQGDVVCVISPNLGVLDAWLPVLFAARAQHPTWTFTAVVPAFRTSYEVVHNDTLVALADDVFDRVVWRDGSDRFRAASTIRDAGIAAQRQRVRDAALTIGDELSRRLRVRRLKFVARKILRLIPPYSSGNLRAPTSHSTVVCNDLYVEARDEYRPIAEAFTDDPVLSQTHGLGLILPDKAVTQRRPQSRRVVAALAGPDEIEGYRQRYALRDEEMLNLGIARHDPQWMAQVTEASRRLHSVPSGPNAMLISRPSGLAALPRDRKVEALRAMHKVVVEEYGYRLLIKLHPKERDKQVFFDALPMDSWRSTWDFSRAHPWHLAAESDFAICFDSGVPIDLIPLGVPTIQFADVRDLPPWNRDDVARDAHGRIIHTLMHELGLVLPASDVGELRSHLDMIRSDRATVMAGLQAAYQATYTVIDKPIDVLVAQLEQLMSS